MWYLALAALIFAAGIELGVWIRRPKTIAALEDLYRKEKARLQAKADKYLDRLR